MAEFVGLVNRNRQGPFQEVLDDTLRLRRFEDTIRWDGGMVATTPPRGPADAHCPVIRKVGSQIVCEKIFVEEPAGGEQGKPLDVQAVTARQGCYGTVLIETEGEPTVTLVSDAIGTVPIYVTSQNGVLYFSSRLSELQLLPGLDLQVSAPAVIRYLNHKCMWPGDTPYRGIRVVRGGTWERFTRSSHEVHQHWDYNYRHQDWAGTADEMVEECWRRLCNIMSRYIGAFGTVGIMLSGGLDSALMVLAAKECTDTPPHTYSVVFGPEYADVDERGYARFVADQTGARHHELELTEKVLHDRLARFVSVSDTPATGGLVPFMTLEASAADEVSVLLNGNGADTAFGLDKQWLTVDRVEKALLLPRLLGVEAYARLAGALGGPMFMPVLRRVVQVSRPLRNARHYFRLRAGRGSWTGSKMVPADIDRTLLPAWRRRQGTTTTEATRRLFAACGSRWFSDMMGYVALKTYLYSHGVRTMSLMSACYGPRMLLPFMDPELLTFATTLPMAWRRRTGKTKYIVRQLCRRLGDEFAQRPKMAFRVPLGDWLNRELSHLAEDVLSDEAMAERGLLDGDQVRRARAEMAAGRLAWVDIWAYVMLELWLREQEKALGRRLVVAADGPMD
ncbi:MAG: asparagine synthetase B family protein [Planctomycetota bacterium]|jgi:asparagine synthase (glutamine-hydrolysing)